MGEFASINLYGYVDADSINWNDPFGLRPLSPCEKQALAPFIRKEDLDSANLHVDKVPWWLPKSFAGVTENNDIYFAPGIYNPKTVKGLALLGHELVHVGQYKRNGLTRLKYLLASTKGYDKNPYEPPAYAMQDLIQNTLTGSPCSH